MKNKILKPREMLDSKGGRISRLVLKTLRSKLPQEVELDKLLNTSKKTLSFQMRNRRMEQAADPRGRGERRMMMKKKRLTIKSPNQMIQMRRETMATMRMIQNSEVMATVESFRLIIKEGQMLEAAGQTGIK